MGAVLRSDWENFLRKTGIYAHGSGASWEWLAMISPCVDFLRKLAREFQQALGDDQGVQHAPADLTKSLDTLMRSFAANEVHVIKNGRRRAEGDGAPVVDVLSQGMRQIVHGTKGPIAEFNRNLEQIQKRHDLKPVTEMARDWRASLGAGDGSTEPGEHLPDGLNHLNQPTTSHAAPSSSESQAKPEGDNTRSEVLQEDLDIDMTMEYDEFNYELPSDIDSLFDYHPPSEADYEAELENADLGYWDEEDDLLVAGLEAFEAAIELEDGVSDAESDDSLIQGL
ncbi:unnamed protein product [Rhizoctonia solani]|uniref:DUF6589 domain-containing protein n=1 Tax=Rhizoctonia solani TaxID=456999 RepID=A0A8H2XC10_9AGAM|nr:unnamed protein product [Rhizoctonia solani]CAE6422109.1 unnamed protein product [Rhizoctonia solani]